MKKSKNEMRKEKLAKLFYEMGMDIELVSKISGVSVDKIKKHSLKQNIDKA